MNTKRKKSGRKLLSFLLTLAMTVGLMPGMGLTVYAETQVNQVNYYYNGGMTLNKIRADFYDDDSLKSFSAEYTWGWGGVKQSLVLLDKLLVCESGDYATTYCKDDNNVSITSYEASKEYVEKKNSGTKFVAESENPDNATPINNGSNTKTLSLAKGAVPSDVSKTYYLFLWTSKSPGEVYPDYHLATVIVSGGKVYLGMGNTPPSIPTYTVTFNTQSHGTAPAGQSVTAGGKVTKPADPTAEGFTFGGWYKEEGCTTAWDFDTDTVTGATTLYAKWIERAKVITPPVPKVNLAYTGDPQELATAGTPENGTMQYALGTDSTNVPTSGWSTSIPAKTDAGTYYVWYKVKGGDGYSDTEAKCIEVTISRSNSSPAISDVALPYTGQPQELVTAGTVSGGTLQYALGTDDVTPPAEDKWSTEIPTGTEPGKYYVWYKVKGDANHNDTKPACVEATIAKKGLTVTADAKSKTQGEADPALTYTAEGLVAGDTLTGALSREAGEDPGTYAITQGTLTAGDNYEITFISAVLTINKKDEPAPVPSGGGSSGGGGGYYGGGAVQNQRRDAYSDVIGAAATNFWGSSPERIRNIELACEKLDGIVLQPGEVFSFNEAVGLRTAEAGFEVAPVDASDEATAEMGGGVSQVSSTLYASALLGLLEPVERTNHPFPVSFIQPGTDALVTNPDDGGNAADLKFRNTRTEPIRISATCRVDEATQLREVLIEIRSALTASDYMPILFDNSWSRNRNGSIPVGAIDYTRPGYRILLTHEEQQFTDDQSAGIRTLTHRKILDAAGMLVRDEILNSKLPDGSYAMDTYYQG